MRSSYSKLSVPNVAYSLLSTFYSIVDKDVGLLLSLRNVVSHLRYRLRYFGSGE
jgi:hypothetical protein